MGTLELTSEHPRAQLGPRPLDARRRGDPLRAPLVPPVAPRAARQPLCAPLWAQHALPRHGAREAGGVPQPGARGGGSGDGSPGRRNRRATARQGRVGAGVDAVRPCASLCQAESLPRAAGLTRAACFWECSAQIEARCMIVSVDKVSEAVDWLEQLTFDVGQKPYQCAFLPSPPLTPTDPPPHLPQAPQALTRCPPRHVRGQGRQRQGPPRHVHQVARLAAQSDRARRQGHRRRVPDPQGPVRVVAGVRGRQGEEGDARWDWGASRLHRRLSSSLARTDGSADRHSVTLLARHASRRAATSTGRQRTAPLAKTFRRPSTAS